MITQTKQFAAVALTHEEARIWSIDPAGHIGEPRHIEAPTAGRRHHHIVEADHHAHHVLDHDRAVFYELVAEAVEESGFVLLIGHGTGKASAMLELVDFWERRHPELARHIVGTIDRDLESITEHQIAALAREWFKDFE